MYSLRLSLIRRSNGIYYIAWYENDKRRYRTTNCTVKSQALQRLKEFDATHTSKQSPVLLSTFVAEFIKFAQSGYSPKTLDIFNRTLKQFQSAVGENLLLTEISAQHLDRYMAERLQQVKPVSVHVEMRAIRAALTKAVSWGMLQRSPFRKENLPRVPETAPAFLAKPDFQLLLDTIKETWLREMIVFAVLTGMRRGEILAMQWSQVDLVNRLICIETTSAFRTKQGKRRTIPINETLTAMLNAHVGRDTSAHVFHLAGNRISEDYVTHKFKRYLRAAKLNENLHFHSLRHSCASWLAQEGISIFLISKLLGHSSVGTTEKFYAHLHPEHLRNAVNSITVSLN